VRQGGIGVYTRPVSRSLIDARAIALASFLVAGAGCFSSDAGGAAAGLGGATGPSSATGSGGRTGSGGTMPLGPTTGSGGVVDSGGAADVGTGGSGGAGGSEGVGGVSAGGGTGAAEAGAGCTRAFLKNVVDAYFTALAAHSASMLPLASNVKFTENGQVLSVGQDGLWKTAGPLKFAITAFDTDSCNTASEAVVPDGSMDIPFALRLKLQGQQLTEIETIAVRPGDYKVGGASFASNTSAIIMSDTSVHWASAVPVAQRNSAQEITAWMDKYFRSFPSGVCNTVSSCTRLENGGGSFSCSAGASCSNGTGSVTPVVKSHIIFADVETGIGVGFDNFMGNCDMHIFKMYGAMVYAVHAILGACAATGWD
jgi:hypothetical protein